MEGFQDMPSSGRRKGYLESTITWSEMLYESYQEE